MSLRLFRNTDILLASHHSYFTKLCIKFHEHYVKIAIFELSVSCCKTRLCFASIKSATNSPTKERTNDFLHLKTTYVSLENIKPKALSLIIDYVSLSGHMHQKIPIETDKIACSFHINHLINSKNTIKALLHFS